jgi:hypothetical protein
MSGFKVGDEVVVVSNSRVGKVENQRTADRMYNVRFENGELLCYKDYELSSVRDFSKDVRLATVSNVRELLLSDEFVSEFARKYSEAKKVVLESAQPPKGHTETPNKWAENRQAIPIPEGWRELLAHEVPKASDMNDSTGAWLARGDGSSSMYLYSAARHIRKIEPANPSETPNGSIPDPGEGYRTPHPGDAGKQVEVRDSEDIRHCDARWVERTLVAVVALPVDCYDRNDMGEFVCSTEGKDAKHICHLWRFARIKEEQSQGIDTSETPNSSVPESSSPWVSEKQKPGPNEVFPNEIQGVWVEPQQPTEWIPKIGDKVRVVRTGRVGVNGKFGIIVDLPGYEYAVRMESEGFTLCNLKADDLELIEAANPSETPKSSTVKPGYFDDIDEVWVDEPNPFDGRKIEAKPTEWIPKVGDKVRVNWPGRDGDNEVGVIVNGDAGEYAVRLDLDNLISSNLKARHLELIEAAQAPADHIADANKMVNPSETPNSSIPDPLNCVGEVCDPAKPIGVTCCPLAIPDGWRELEPHEIPMPGDLQEWGGAWKERTSVSNHEYESHQIFHLRKIETAKEPEYREPTYADLANGPIEVEVNDDERDECAWVKRMLYAVLPAHVRIRFVCNWPRETGSIHRWNYARIKVS